MVDTEDPAIRIQHRATDAPSEQNLLDQSMAPSIGVYGLPEAVDKIQSLKATISALSEDRTGLLERMQKLKGAVEKLSDENGLLRQQAGMAAADHIDVSGVQLAKETLVAELRAVNACLERELGELEEEQKRLKAHLKFTAKFQGQIQPDLGLSPKQLTAIEVFVEQLKSRSKEESSEGAAADASTPLKGSFGASQALGLLPNQHDSPTSAAQHSLVFKTTIDALPCMEGEGTAVVGQAVPKNSRLIHAEFGEESATSLDKHSWPVALSESDDHARITERQLSAATEQQKQAEVHMQQEQPKLATKSSANEDPNSHQELWRVEQECCMAQEQSRKLEEHVRSLQQQLAMLNSKLASSNLCIEELQAEKATMVSATSLQQLGNAQKSAKAESNAAEHAVSTHQCEAETELEALRAQVNQLEADKQAYLSRCEQLDVGLEDIRNQFPHDALERKYADAVSRMAGVTCKLASATASENILRAEKLDLSRRYTDRNQRMQERLRGAQLRADRQQAQLQQAQQQLQDHVSLEAHDGLKQQLHKLSKQHSALMAQHQAWPAEGSTTHDSELARLRSELAQARMQAGLNADKLAATLETCRVQGRQLQGSEGQAPGGGAAVEAQLVQDLVQGQVDLASALRRADTAELQARHAEQSVQDAHDTSQHLQAQLEAVTRQLHQTRQEKASLETHHQGGACYEEVHDLWQRVTKAEQAASQAAAELQAIRDAARHATLELKDVKGESALRHAEAADLRSALREAHAGGAIPQALASLQVELSHVRSKLSMAQSTAHQYEGECSSLQQDNQTLTCQLSRAEGQLKIADAKLRWERAQHLQARAASEISTSSLLPAYKAEAWLRKMQHLQKHNNTLAEQLDLLSQRLLASQQAQSEADLRLQHAAQHQDKQEDSSTGAQSAALLQMRVDNARLSRSDAALRAKGNSLEEALHALEARLSEYEAEAMGQHAILEQDKQQAERSCVKLKEEILRLQGEIQTQDADLAELHLRCQSAERRAAEKGSATKQDSASSANNEGRATKTDTRNLLLAQVEQLRQCRLEGQAYKEQAGEAQQQLTQQTHSLQRLQQQHQQLLEQVCQHSHRALAQPAVQMHQHEGTALDQVQALAQSTIQDLHSKLAARSVEVEEGGQRLEAAQRQAAAEVGSLQDQIEQLTHQLQLQDQRHIKTLVESSVPPPRVPNVSSPRHSHLHHLLKQVSQDRDDYQTRLQQLQAQYDWKVDQLQQHAAQQQQACAQLKMELHAAQQAEGRDRGEQRRQALAAAAKDAKLAHLRRNIQSLEAKLIHAMHTNADRVTEEGREQGQLQVALQDKAHLQALVQKLQLEVTELKHRGAVLPTSPLHQEKEKQKNAQSVHSQADNADSALAAQGRVRLTKLIGEDEQLRKDKQDLLARLNNMEPEVKSEDDERLARLDTEVGTLKTERQLLIGRLRTAEQLVAEARGTIDQKEGHLQGLQKLLEEEERASRGLQQQLRQQASSAALAQPSAGDQSKAPNLQAERRQQQIADLQQQVQLLQQQLQQAESSRPDQPAAKQPLHEQQTPQNPRMAEAKAEAHDRPAWQNPMALHLSEADKAELHMAEAGLPGDENGAPQSLLGGHPGLWLWEEKKKIQKRMDSLRAKLKEKGNAVEQLSKEKQKKGEQLQQAHADLARQAALIKDLQSQAKKKDNKHAGVPAEQDGAGKGADSSRQGLLDTIQGLQRALERSRKECEAAVSSAKYMQLLEKKKELSKKCTSLEEEARIATGIKDEAHRLEQRCQQIQVSNTALKKQLKALQQGHNQAKALTEQVEGLEAAVNSRDAELITLRKTLEHKEGQLAQLKMAEGAVDEEAAEEIALLRDKLASTEAENADMREELSAFDPAFFDEIEDLKYDHHQLQLQCSEYENIVRELSSQLGIDSAALATRD